MRTSLRSVQWFTIQDVADIWAPHLEMPKAILLRELQYGFYKWHGEKLGKPGLQCGRPLVEMPPNEELPPLDQLLDRQFLRAFSAAQGWPLPPVLSGEDAAGTGFVGRPSIAPAIGRELLRIASEGNLESTLADQARELQKWAEKNYPGNQVPTAKVIENNIRTDFRRLKKPSTSQ